ncbi:MAG: hypothetical protein AMXMBFR74_04420 [Parvibaculum sp.]|jgi:cholesterol transport system auxiliary component|uniref:ABC-type transport auxiliary lipoprotein family protein n=1 Tax=Parvibaculum sp. TaxID=2024848 RepID=UPI0035B9F882
MTRYTALFSRLLLLVFAALPLSACALADIASGPPPSLYVLTAPQVEVPAGPGATAQLVVEEFAAPAAIDTARVVYKSSPHSIAYYAGARWADRAPRMIASLAVETLTGTGRFPAVTGPGARVRMDLALSGDIRAFEAYRASATGLGESATGVRVSLFVRLVRLRDHSIVASREFTAEAKAGSGMDGVVAGYDAALDEVLAALALWTLEQSLAAMPEKAGR